LILVNSLPELRLLSLQLVMLIMILPDSKIAHSAMGEVRQTFRFRRANPRFREHLDGEFLDTFVPTSDLRLASRLLAAELVIQLLEECWPSSFHVDGLPCYAKS
jgi:hypothetical protein